MEAQEFKVVVDGAAVEIETLVLKDVLEDHLPDAYPEAAQASITVEKD